MPRDADAIDARPEGDRGKTRLLCLADLDGRTRSAQMVARSIDAITSDLGGQDALSAAEVAIVRRAAITGAMAEDVAARWLLGEPVDPATFATLTNSERRLLETVGLQRRPRDVSSPSITDYVKETAHV